MEVPSESWELLLLIYLFIFLYKWFLQGLTEKTVTNSLHPSNREKDNTKLTTKIIIEQK